MNKNLPVVTLKSLQFRWFENQPPVLDIEELEIQAGERIFIKGPSGSGKTTLLNLLAGVLLPTSGTVKILDTDIATLSSADRDGFRASHIGFVFQIFNLIPYLTLVENVTLPCGFSDARRKRVEQNGTTLEQEAKRLLTHLKLDPAYFEDRSASQLSVGQQQRVAVARALIGRPEIIICDEPTSSLDADARQSFLDLLFQEVEAAEATLIFVSHDSQLAKGFNRTVDLPAIHRGTS